MLLKYTQHDWITRDLVYLNIANWDFYPSEYSYNAIAQVTNS